MKQGRVIKGYKLLVVDGDGVLQGTVQLEGYDLDHPIAASELAREIRDELPAEAFD